MTTPQQPVSEQPDEIALCGNCLCPFLHCKCPIQSSLPTVWYRKSAPQAHPRQGEVEGFVQMGRLHTIAAGKDAVRPASVKEGASMALELIELRAALSSKPVEAKIPD